MDMEIVDARKEGIPLALLAAGLSLETGVCLIFYNPDPAEILGPFFEQAAEEDLPTWLSAIAVHEATHCIEQREAYLRHRFAKVLPPGMTADGMTVQSYLVEVKSGNLETWGEALADIASLLYLQQTVPERWTTFARGLAALRRDLAGHRPEHDTSPWLRQVIAAYPDQAAGPDIFEAAFRLRREYQPR